MNSPRRRPLSSGLFLLSAALMAAAAAAKARAEAPSNDNFASPAILSTSPLAGTTVDATREAGEPVYTYSRRSVWYQWTAPANGWKRVEVAGTETTIENAPTVAVLGAGAGGAGAGLRGLTRLSMEEPGGRSVRFQATAGTVYFFHVNELGTPGKFQLSLSDSTAPAAPANDAFSAALTIPSALPQTISGTFLDATAEAREPNVYNFGSRASVWHRWVAPAGADWLDVWLTDVGEACGIRLYTAAANGGITQLSPVTPRFLDRGYPESFYRVTPGVTYFLQLYQDLGASRPYTLHLESFAGVGPEDNDAFAARVNLGNAATVTRDDGSTDNATVEPGEPLPVESLTSTVWYSWTAPANGAVEIRTLGGQNQDTFLAVYTGSGLSALSLQAFNEDIDASEGDWDSRVVIAATAGTTYQIQVGSAYAAWDDFSLSIKPVDNALLPPRVLAFTPSAAQADVSSGAVTLTCEVTLSAALENAGDLLVSLELPDALPAWGGPGAVKFLLGQNSPPALISGATYRKTFQLPAGLPPGAYPVLIDVSGAPSGPADGLVAYGGKGGVALPGNVSALTIVNNGALTPAPALTSFSMTPSTVDASAGDTEVLLSAQATGLPSTEPLTLILTDSLGGESSLSVPALLHDGSSWKASLTIRKGAKPAQLHPTLVLQNSSFGRDFGWANAAADPLPAGSPEALTITGTNPDRLPPQLRNFTFDSSAVSLAAGDWLLGGTFEVEDENRLSWISLGMDDGLRVINPEFTQTRISGSAQSGVYRWGMLIPRDTPDGTYYAVAGLTDGVGNTLDFSPVPGFDTWPVNVPFSFTITRGGEESAESIWMDAQNFTGLDADQARTATAVNADPDGDGIPNLLEFYFGTNPADPFNTGGAASLPAFSWTGSALRLDFAQSAANLALGRAGSKLSGQFSTDLGTWTEVSVSSPAPGLYRVESPAAGATGGRGFLRIQAAPLR